MFDIDVCHNFMKDVAPFVGKIASRRFLCLDYKVSNEEFVIKVSYGKDQFQDLINSYVCEMIDDGWTTNSVLCDDIETEVEYFLNAVTILVPRE